MFLELGEVIVANFTKSFSFLVRLPWPLALFLLGLFTSLQDLFLIWFNPNPPGEVSALLSGSARKTVRRGCGLTIKPQNGPVLELRKYWSHNTRLLLLEGRVHAAGAPVHHSEG